MNIEPEMITDEIVKNTNLAMFTDYDSCKNRIVCCVINKKKNKEILVNVPHVNFLDLAVVFRYVFDTEDLIENNDTVASAIINNTIFKGWNVSLTEMYKNAIQNDFFQHGTCFQNLEDLLQSISSVKIERVPYSNGCPAFVITNGRNWYGASCILNQKIMEKIAEQFGSNFLILPSSIHELLVIPDDNEANIDDLRKMVMEVNRQVDDNGVRIVPDEQFLSDNVYRYERETQLVSIA